MASNKKFRFGPLLLTATTTTNLLNPAGATGGTNAGSSGQYIILTHIRINNRSTVTTATPSLFLGLTGANTAGTEIAMHGIAMLPNTVLDHYFGSGIRLDTTDFLVGGASSASCLVITGEGEVGVAG